MRKLINKLFTLLMVAFVGISLVGCKDSSEETVETNKNVPYGNLSDSVIYATAGKNDQFKLGQKTLYNELRVNGYDYLFEEILRVLVTPEQFGLNITDNYDELVELINEKCYGTSDEKALEKLNSTSKADSVKQFKDQMFLVNVTVEDDNIYTESCLEYFLNQLAQKYYAMSLINDPESKYYWANEYQMENGEYIYEDGKKVGNIYHIKDETIEAEYEAKFEETAEYNVVVLATNTLAEAYEAIDATALEGLTNEKVYEAFKTAYENLYSYKTVNEETFFLTTEELSGFNSNVLSIVDKMEAGDMKLYQQFGDVIYSIYLQGEKPEADYSTITETEKKELVEELIKEQATQTVVSSLLIEKVYETDIVIYDYVYDALYAAENEDHTQLAASEWKAEYNNYVAKISFEENGQTVTEYITVEDFYNTLEQLLGLTTALDYFSSKVLLASEFADDLTDEDLEKIDEEFKKALESFNNGEYESYGYPTSIGEDVFKFIYYGQTNDDEIIEYYKSQKIWEYYTADQPENYNSILYTIGQNYYEKYFDLSVKHILLTVDYNLDGTPDDPEIFANKLDAAGKVGYTSADFEKEIVRTMTAIVNEANYIVENKLASMVDALDFILDAFYSNDKLLSNPQDSWANYKEFGIGLTIEDLGSVNNSSASKYVKEFGLGVNDLYQYLVSEEIVKDGELKDDYLDTRFTTAEESDKINHMIKTTYGYHILSAYDTTEISSAKYESDEDYNEQYDKVEIEVDGEETTANAYNTNEWASLNQILIYVSQVNTDDGVTGLPSSVKAYINKYYSTFTSKYNNDTFKNILLAETQINVKFAGTDNAKYEEFMNIQKRKYDSYADFSSTSIDVLAGWWDLVLMNPIVEE